MKKIGLVIISILLLSLWNSNIVANAKNIPKYGTKKTNYGEYICEDGYITAVRRGQFGQMAKGIEECKVAAGPYGSSVFVRKAGKKKSVYEIGMKYKSFPFYLISKKDAEFYPVGAERMIFADKKGEFRYTGFGHCFFLFHHKKEKQCDNSGHFFKKEKVKVLQGASKVWSDNGGIAYIKNNNLYIAYSEPTVGCYDDEMSGIHTYFTGKGDQIKKVVVPYNGGPIFVLMRDGSLWGMGDNTSKLICNRKIAYVEQFIKLNIENVKDIACNGVNTGVLKKDGTFWVWGRILKNRREYTCVPQYIAGKVKEIAIGTNTDGKDKSLIIYLKENGCAYGFGGNKGYATYMITCKNKKNWIKKPVLLMKKVKHVYATDDLVLILNRKKELLWQGMFTGTQFTSLVS